MPQNNPQKPIFIHKDLAFIPAPQFDEDVSDRVNLLYPDIPERRQQIQPANYDFRSDNFKQEVRFLLTKIQELYVRLNPGNNNVNIQRFRQEFLFETPYSKFENYRAKNNVDYFASVKKQLETNYLLLLRREEMAKMLETQQVVGQLVDGLGVCAPGLIGHLEDVRVRLTSQQNIVYWLASLRTQIVGRYAHRINQDVHTHIAYNNQANQLGYAILKNQIEDIIHVHIGNIAPFKQYMQDEYNQKAIIECVESGLLDLIKNFNEAFPVDAEGWITIGDRYNDIQRLGDQIVNALKLDAEWKGLNFNDLFDATEDFLKIRFNPQLNIQFTPHLTAELKGFIQDRILKPQNLLTEDNALAFKAFASAAGQQPRPQQREEAPAQIRPRAALQDLEEQMIRIREDIQNNENALNRLNRQNRQNGQNGQNRQNRQRYAKNMITTPILCALAIGLTAGICTMMLGLGWLLTSIVISPVLFEIAMFSFTNWCTQKLHKKENITQPEAEAFEDGLTAQKSLVKQITCCFKWNDYRNMTAFYAGKGAMIGVDNDLIEKVRGRAQRI